MVCLCNETRSPGCENYFCCRELLFLNIGIAPTNLYRYMVTCGKTPAMQPLCYIDAQVPRVKDLAAGYRKAVAASLVVMLVA